MKSKPEYRPIFTSPTVYYRVLHILSTRRYRFPVRRYILDLFEVQLDADVANTLAECAHVLAVKEPEFAMGTRSASTSPKTSKVQQPRIASMFGRPGRARAASESDDDDDSVDSDLEDEEDKAEVGRPVSLLPVRKIVGFVGSQGEF